jgi:hypothetical protein
MSLNSDKNSPVRVVSSKVYILAGRSFLLKRLEIKGFKPKHGILQISGDGLSVSFHSSAGPFRLIVSGDTIQFGGHTFTPSTTAHQYVVDGARHTLQSARRYVFSDGELIGVSGA